MKASNLKLLRLNAAALILALSAALAPNFVGLPQASAKPYIPEQMGDPDTPDATPAPGPSKSTTQKSAMTSLLFGTTAMPSGAADIQLQVVFAQAIRAWLVLW